MTEDTAQKERRLAKELAQVRSKRAAEDRTTKISRDYSVGGTPPDTSHKPSRGSSDTPDVVQLPTKKRRKTENKW